MTATITTLHPPVCKDADWIFLHRLEELANTLYTLSEGFEDIRRHEDSARLAYARIEILIVANRYAEDVKRARGI